MFIEMMKNILVCYFLLTYVQALGYTERPTQDLYSTRANTLSDDSDDIQKQLDNEAKDRMKFGTPKTIWVFHFPVQTSRITFSSNTEDIFRLPRRLKLLRKEPDKEDKGTDSCADDTICTCPATLHDDATEAPFNLTAVWSYKDQVNWSVSYPDCGGSFQSPVSLPVTGMVLAKSPKGSRSMLFLNYDVQPKSMTVVHDGNTVSLFGEWAPSQRPLIYGGAAYGRRYVFHSLALRWPSEHKVGSLVFPLESQAIHVSVEYETIDDAIRNAGKDKLALLAVSNIYKHSDHSHKGLEQLIKSIQSTSYGNSTLPALPLKFFVPPLKKYAAYHGSLTTPPCTESVLWLVRDRTLPIERGLAETLQSISISNEEGQTNIRQEHPLNDRKLYFFQ